MKNAQTAQHFLKAAIEKTSGLRSVLFFVFVTVACLNFSGKQALAGDFSRSCVDLALNGTTLSATCKDDSANIRKTSLDLNSGIGNRDGHLEGTRGFASTCKNVSLDGTKLRGDCRTFKKDYRSTVLNLDQYISNQDGSLVFDFRVFPFLN